MEPKSVKNIINKYSQKWPNSIYDWIKLIKNVLLHKKANAGNILWALKRSEMMHILDNEPKFLNKVIKRFTLNEQEKFNQEISNHKKKQTKNLEIRIADNLAKNKTIPRIYHYYHRFGSNSTKDKVKKLLMKSLENAYNNEQLKNMLDYQRNHTRYLYNTFYNSLNETQKKKLNSLVEQKNNETKNVKKHSTMPYRFALGPNWWRRWWYAENFSKTRENMQMPNNLALKQILKNGNYIKVAKKAREINRSKASYRALTVGGIKENMREPDRDKAIRFKEFEKFLAKKYLGETFKHLQKWLEQTYYTKWLQRLYRKIDNNQSMTNLDFWNKISRWNPFGKGRKHRSKTRVFLDVLHILYTNHKKRKTFMKNFTNDDHKRTKISSTKRGAKLVP